MAGILGVVILAMYGDRTLFYQDPYTYTGTYTKLTPLGETQQLQLGGFLRSHYLNPNSPNFINGVSPDLVNDRQIKVRVDNGGEQGVIGDSAVALLQGLFPPTSKSRTYLANGTTVVGPFNGYQYIPVESVEPDQSIQLEGWTKCPNFEKHVRAFYDSPEFKKKAQEAKPFLDEIKPYLFGIPNTLENIYNIYDYMKVNYIHNETYAFKLPPTSLAQAQALVDWHEHGVFTSKKGDGMGNIAGRTILPSIIHYLERIADQKDPLVLALQEVSYKPFISLFNLTGLDERYPDTSGVPNYASAIAFELRLNDEGEAYLRTKFKNGTTDDDFRTLRLFGHKEDIALNEFLYRLDLSAIHSVAEWCKVCGQRTERGCSVCNTDFAPSWPSSGRSRFQLSGGDEKKSINWSEIFEQLWDEYYFAVFSGIAFAVTYAIVKAWKGRRSPQLQGYDPLPTAQPFRDEPPAKRYRF